MCLGFSGFHFNMFYDKFTKTTYCWETKMRSSEAKISKNLINGNITEVTTNNSYIKFINNFEKGECIVYGKHTGKCLVNQYDNTIKVDNIYNNYRECNIEYEFKLKRISNPSIVSIPFPHSNNRTLYSQKDFFKIEGKLLINGKELLTDENINNKQEFFAFNLTHNQSIDEESYNENLIWLENKTSLLPPVRFNRSIPCNKFIIIQNGLY